MILSDDLFSVKNKNQRPFRLDFMESNLELKYNYIIEMEVKI